MIRKLAWCALLTSSTALAQTTGVTSHNGGIDAPSTVSAQLTLNAMASEAQASSGTPQNVPPPGNPAPPTQAPATASGLPGATRLTIHDAEQLALKNNPQIAVSR